MGWFVLREHAGNKTVKLALHDNQIKGGLLIKCFAFSRGLNFNDAKWATAMRSTWQGTVAEFLQQRCQTLWCMYNLNGLDGFKRRSDTFMGNRSINGYSWGICADSRFSSIPLNISFTGERVRAKCVFFFCLWALQRQLVGFWERQDAVSHRFLWLV